MLMDLVRQNRSYRGYDRSRKIREEELVSDCEQNSAGNYVGKRPA